MSITKIGDIVRKEVRRLFPGVRKTICDFGLELAGVEESVLDNKLQVLVLKDGTKVMLGVLEFPNTEAELAPRELLIVGAHPLADKEQLERVIDEHNHDQEKHPWKLCFLQARVLLELP